MLAQVGDHLTMALWEKCCSSPIFCLHRFTPISSDIHGLKKNFLNHVHAMLCRATKRDESWWRVLTKCGPLEKGIANHFSILALSSYMIIA